MPNKRVGRTSIFRDKIDGAGVLREGAQRVQAIISPKGSRRFEEARRRLATLADREPEQVSDADVVEYLARGEQETRNYLRALQKAAAAEA